MLEYFLIGLTLLFFTALTVLVCAAAYYMVLKCIYRVSDFEEIFAELERLAKR